MKLPRNSESLSKIPPFNATQVLLPDVHKTGLGSSAALITSVVCALLLHLQVVPPSAFAEDHSEGRRLAHNLAQFVHCLAQGKVGSGFDVSAAVFGSQLYTRFDAAVLSTLMNEEEVRCSTNDLLLLKLISYLLRRLVNSLYCRLFHRTIKHGITARNRLNYPP